MKIKENISAISNRKLIPIFGCSFAVGLILRCIQIATLIESDTGFYSNSSVITTIFNVIMIVSCVGFAVCAYLSKDSANIYTCGLKSKALFLSTLIFSVSLFADAFYSFFHGMLQSDSSGNFSQMMSTGALPSIMQGIFAFLSAIYMFILANSFLRGDDKASKRKILVLSPVGWIIFRLISHFVKKISFVNVSDLFYELIMFGFAALFFMALAQVTSNVYRDGFRWRIIGFGLPVALIAAVLSFSRLVFTFVDSSKYINPTYPLRVTDLFLAMFVFILCVETSTLKKTVSVDANANQEFVEIDELEIEELESDD